MLNTLVLYQQQLYARKSNLICQTDIFLETAKLPAILVLHSGLGQRIPKVTWRHTWGSFLPQRQNKWPSRKSFATCSVWANWRSHQHKCQRKCQICALYVLKVLSGSKKSHFRSVAKRMYYLFPNLLLNIHCWWFQNVFYFCLVPCKKLNHAIYRLSLLDYLLSATLLERERGGGEREGERERDK